MASKVTYKLNLGNIFDNAYSGSSRAVRDKTRPIISNQLFKRTYGLNVIEAIQKRTQEDNVDRKDKPLAKYAESYKKSTIFKIYGKEPSNVNLTLTGEMLSSMDVEPGAGTNITIYFVDKTNNDKAHGHINGIKTKRGRVRRDFFGLPSDEEARILRDTIANQAREMRAAKIATAMSEEA